MAFVESTTSSTRPTHVRHAIVGVTAIAAFLMYIDRMCLSQMVTADSFQHEMGMSKTAVGSVLSVFFFAYALAQLPAGWLADRFSTRKLMTCLIAVWSGFTLLTGFATGFWTLVFARIGCALAEAGAYPASGGLLPRWVPLHSRGRANGIVSSGGRFGGAAAPWITALTIAYLGTWRVPGWIFGGVGLLFAGVFWIVFRDRPAEHPLCNLPERELIERDQISEPRSASAGVTHVRTPWKGLLCSTDMWLMCLYQYLTNVGWVFLVTLMPTFLRQIKGMSEVTAGRMSTMALLAGLVGMLSGGWITDSLTTRFGLRRGRMIPLAWSRVVGAAAYLLCIKFDSAWSCVVAFGVVAAMTDVSIPATWGYIQDVGGRNIAATLAWPNMWGNLGAALTPKLLPWINSRFDAHHNWHASLGFLAGAFLLSGFVALGIRADVKIEPSDQDNEPRGFPVITKEQG